jgi:hypothetical protein
MRRIHMKSFAAALATLLLLTGASVSAQSEDPTMQSVPTDHPKQRVVTGTIKDIDLRPGGTVTLEDGTTLTIPQDSTQMEWTSLPETGQQVEVTYDEQNVVRSIDTGVGGADSGGSGGQ